MTNKSNNVLIPAICPQCGANIQLDKNIEKGYCSFCGTEIIIKDIVKKVKIVNNPTFDNYMKLGDRAYDDKDYEKAIDNYKHALTINPDDWKAIYREGICDALTTNLNNFNIDKAFKSTKTALKILEEKAIEPKELASCKARIAIDLINVCELFLNFAINHYNQYCELENSANKLWNHLLEIRSIALYIINSLLTEETIKLYPKDSEKNNITNWKNLIIKTLLNVDVGLCEVRTYRNGNTTYKKQINSTLRNNLVMEYDKYLTILKKTQPNYTPYSINRTGMSKGCYIATSIYGSYDCPEVWTLRRFRDYYLDKHILGKIFIKVYYSISPTVVKIFGKNKYFNYINKKFLDKVVTKLNNIGYINTKYND